MSEATAKKKEIAATAHHGIDIYWNKFSISAENRYQLQLDVYTSLSSSSSSAGREKKLSP
jgi:hypothetical protein